MAFIIIGVLVVAGVVVVGISSLANGFLEMRNDALKFRQLPKKGNDE